MDYSELRPFGFIPGPYEVLCHGCGQKWALMAADATHCKRCARNKMKEVSLELDISAGHLDGCFLAMGGGLCTCGAGAP